MTLCSDTSIEKGLSLGRCQPRWRFSRGLSSREHVINTWYDKRSSPPEDVSA